MKAKTIKGRAPAAIKTAFQQCLADGFKPSLAIIFLSIKQDLQAVSEIFDTAGIAIFGATTAGEFIDGEVGEGSIVVMLLDMNPDYFKLAFLETAESTSFIQSRKLGEMGKNIFTNPAFMLVSGWLTQDGENILAGITEGFGGDATIFGGMAADDILFEGPLVFTNNKSSDKGLLALIINEDKVDVNGIATCGWKAVGTTKTVTKSEGNIVYTIDDKPALDMILKYLGIEFDFEAGKEIVSQLGAFYPLQLEREGSESVMRTAMFANRNDHSVIYSGNVPQGCKVKFSLPPDFDTVEKVVEECTELKNKTQPEADALVMFSCKSRHFSFGVLMEEEINQVKKVWNAPMIGFFTYGEFGKSKTGKHEFHNNTCCLVALKEK